MHDGIPLSSLPIIDIRPLLEGTEARHEVGKQIGRACREIGFFYIVGHGVSEVLQKRLEELSHRFFAEPLSAKMEIEMSRGGSAWRGYFPVGQELTSGKPDLKEGLYFGSELGPDHPMVQADTPMHGANLFPKHPAELRQTVLEYIDAMTHLGHALMRGMALSLGLEESYFADHYTGDPLTLFRIFNYPPAIPDAQGELGWGVGEHTDYGVLTILKQDDCGGLQVKSKEGWMDAPPIPNSFVCNIGDMLDRMTGGLYHSNLHRVRNQAGRNRLSFPFFFDPNFNAEVKPIELGHQIREDRLERWDQVSVYELSGTYGDYILGKVSKVFPQLRKNLPPGFD